MFFLTEIERKNLISSILPAARKVGVSSELRGWNWMESPLKPLYLDERIPNNLIASQYCKTGRDVYVSKVKKVKGQSNMHIWAGNCIHKAVSTVLLSFVEGEELPQFEQWWENEERASANSYGQEPSQEMSIKKITNDVWSYTVAECQRAILERRSAQPYASEHDIRASALPFLVEHKVDGRLLGLSELLSVDCYDYLHGIIFDLKYLRPTSVPESWRRLYIAGYAVALESTYEIPVDVGCVVYVTGSQGKLRVSKDLFFIGDDIRGWWLEERDKKLEIIAQKKDPGLPKICYDACLFLHYCLGDQK